ncbi:YbfA family protein [Pantoea sp. FN060301]|uniref:YbfA family protein n=1 Tax=Pantoea sp. FN060301 TaxID=3420380 RepID=UPI003D16484C
MRLYQPYSLSRIVLRRLAVLIVGTVALPVMLFRHDRARFYSYLHRIWSKTSSQPVWLAQSEAAACDFY